MVITLNDVALHAGVSAATASRVLAGKDGVSSRARAAVLEAAEALGYNRARGPARRLVGLLLPELENPVFATFAQRLATMIAKGGDLPIVCSQNVDGVVEDEWLEMLVEREIAGLIAVSGLHADTLADTARYRRLRERGVALVLVNGFVKGLDAVFVSDDDRAAMHLAVAHLAELGHDRIGLAVGPDRYTPVLRKMAGYRDALAAAGDHEPLIEHGPFTIEGGRAATLHLLDAGVTAVVCASDLMALGAIDAARSRGLRVPEDLSVVGYDDSPTMAFTAPPLTTVRQPVLAMCKAAVRALHDELALRPLPRREYVFRPELLVRGSTGAAPSARAAAQSPPRAAAAPET
jgi:DNA-binding LacI/PurR family transcriptional regulator